MNNTVEKNYKEKSYEEMTDEDILELRKNIGMVFQNPDNQIVATIVEDDVAFGPENLGVPPMEIRARVDAALADVGMTSFARHEPHRLSGGQKQRGAIAGIIAMMPHYMEEAAMADRIMVMDDGAVIMDGTPSDVFEKEALLRSCGLNVPQCTELIHRLRDTGFSLDGECVTVEQCAELLARLMGAEV